MDDHESTEGSTGRSDRRRRGVAAVVAAGVLGVVAAVSAGALEADPDRADTPPVTERTLPQPAVDPTSSADPHATVWPPWNPRKDLPPAPDHIAPALPEVIAPPHSSPMLADDPVGSAVAVAVRDRTIQVLGRDGGWRSLPVDRKYPRATISPGGTRVAVTYYAFYDTGPVIHDLRTGTSRVLPFPEDYRPYEDTWTFVDEDSLLLSAGRRAWIVDARTGAARRVPNQLGGGLSTAVDPTGGILVSADWTRPNVLTDFRGDEVRSVSMRRTGRLSALRAGRDTVVGTSYDDRPFAVVVADRETLTPRAVLPVVDRDANFSNGGLGTVALTDDGIVLLRVATLGRRVDGFRVVAWDPDTGELSGVSRTEELLAVDLAEGLL